MRYLGTPIRFESMVEDVNDLHCAAGAAIIVIDKLKNALAKATKLNKKERKEFVNDTFCDEDEDMRSLMGAVGDRRMPDVAPAEMLMMLLSSLEKTGLAEKLGIHIVSGDTAEEFMKNVAMKEKEQEESAEH